MASFLIQPFQPSGQIVTDEDEQSHDRQIVDKEEDQRFAVIKKHEMSPQEKVFSELPPEKGIYAIACNACRQKPRDPSACRSLFLSVFSHGDNHRIPMQSQVQRHQDVIQIGTDQMDASSNRCPFADLKKTVQMLRQDDPADSRCNHRDDHQQDDSRLKDAKGSVSALEKHAKPASVQHMMHRKQDDHDRAEDLMCQFSDQRISRQAEENCCHPDIDDHAPFFHRHSFSNQVSYLNDLQTAIP